MQFQEFIESKQFILTEGSIYERLRRFPQVQLDAQIANASLVYNPDSSQILRTIVDEYLEVGARNNLPMFVLTNTWRANQVRVGRSEFADMNVNFDCAQFYKDIIAGKSSSKPNFLGGLMGCQGDAYKPEESLSMSEAYNLHKWQARALANAGVDFLFASTLPALEEARGLAKAMAETGMPYILSFVIRPDGKLLDGNSLAEAVNVIDSGTDKAPVRYMINCSHSSAFRNAYPLFADVAHRVGGLQANTSAKDPSLLDGVEELETELAGEFASSMRKLREDFNCQILGGCCGTDDTHIEALAKQINKIK